MMKSARQFKRESEYERCAHVMLDPVAWLASYEDTPCLDDTATSIGEEFLRKNNGDLKLALVTEPQFRAELITAYLLGNSDIKGVARLMITEVSKMLDQIEFEQNGQH